MSRRVIAEPLNRDRFSFISQAARVLRVVSPDVVQLGSSEADQARAHQQRWRPIWP